MTTLGTDLSRTSCATTISILRSISAFQVGALFALYERAGGFYASPVNINDRLRKRFM
jgi:hypothetical protein